MSTNIPLYQRTELPPARAGEAKIPYELAEQPEVEFGRTVARFTGDILDRLIRAQAANEEAEARGKVNTFIESYSTFVADRPNASPEELQKEWDKISAQIKAIPDTLKTGIAKRNFTNFLALNEGIINQRAQTSMEAIKSRQELERFNAGRKSDMANFDTQGLIKRYDAQVKSGLLDKETAKIQMENDIIAIEEAKREQAVDNAVGSAFAVWESTVTEANPDGDLNIAFDFVDSIEGISGEDKKKIETSLKTRVQNRRAEAKLTLEQQREKSRDFLNDKFANNQIPTPEEIDKSGLDENEQKQYIKWAAAETRRVEKGEAIVTDSKVRTEFYRDITHILTGAQIRNDVLKRVQEARFGENPTIDEPDYQKLLTAMEAQYEQGYGQMMSKVNSYAEGILLNPDSLGIIKNAPIRYKALGDFEERWMQWIASQGDKLKLADIYPEGRRMAASFQISDVEAERQEKEQVKALEAKEKKAAAKEKEVEKRQEGETIQEYLERTGR